MSGVLRKAEVLMTSVFVTRYIEYLILMKNVLICLSLMFCLFDLNPD